MSLRGDNLVKVYSKRSVVNDLSIGVERGEIVGLLGPNGAGKTTTFYMLVGLIKPNGGNVFLESENITALPMYKRAQRGISYLSQEPSVFRKLTVKENIQAILQITKKSKAEQQRVLDHLLNDLNLTHLANQKAYTLSGGERRRVEICRALVTEPKYLLLDEPFSGIDPIVVGELQAILYGLKQNANLGILITDHNVREVLSIVDRAYIIYEGRVLISGDSNYLLQDQQAREIYLGDKFRMD
ncbi:LPS export ABC transporter ATP-binding protein [bacterium]|nr:LPS export ABC transporter ATP-binding protein [bacterium]